VAGRGRTVGGLPSSAHWLALRKLLGDGRLPVAQDVGHADRLHFDYFDDLVPAHVAIVPLAWRARSAPILVRNPFAEHKLDSPLLQRHFVSIEPLQLGDQRFVDLEPPGQATNRLHFSLVVLMIG
jgi:hypothetical protein